MTPPTSIVTDSLRERTAPAFAPQPDPEAAPVLVPGSLDALWFQLTGTICNIQCAHCFISCGPRNRSFDFLGVEQVERALAQSVNLGVREYYFTGGEPFLHPHVVEILSRSLDYGPTTVLTNGMLLKRRHLEPLAEKAAAAVHSLEFRVSIDGFTADAHDAIRGAGSFDSAMAGVDLLLAHGFLPIITAVQTWDAGRDGDAFDGFVAMLRARGYSSPRIKLLPVLRMGAEAGRAGGHRASERVTQSMIEGFDPDVLLCARARLVTDRGVWVCPILLDEPDAKLADDLTAAAGTAYPLRHAACSTCWRHGAICANPGAAAPEWGLPAASPEPGGPR